MLLTSLLVLGTAAVYVTGVVLLGFLLHSLHHFDPAWFAVLGAAVLCIITNPLNVQSVMHVSTTVPA